MIAKHKKKEVEKMNGEELLPYIEQIYRFCAKRLRNRHDAEDLASEIICHAIEGLSKYKINSLESWIWRIAHNRYARYIDHKNKEMAHFSDKELFEIENDYCTIDEYAIENEFEPIFRALHTLSAQYKDIFVDYYIGEMSVKELSCKYELPESTVKWRLNIGRSKIKERIGDNTMSKIYKRINWETTSCNGNMDTYKYLHSQVARAICLAAYEKPVTVEEISIATGLPTMYIEDELPKLEYGDAIEKVGSKYRTNFIIFSLKNRTTAENDTEKLIKTAADIIEEMLKKAEKKISEMNFYGNNFGIKRLGYILVSYLIRQKKGGIMEKLNLKRGNYPPRKDGGYGWFIVSETADENEDLPEYNSGCNESANETCSIYYYHLGKYFEKDITHRGSSQWLCDNNIIQKCSDGFIPDGVISDEDIARLISLNLAVKDGNKFKLNFPYFTTAQFMELIESITVDNSEFDALFTEYIISLRKSFEKFVPKHLNDQINQWVSCYANGIIAYITEELISQGILEKPDEEKVLVNGVFCVEGKLKSI